MSEPTKATDHDEEATGVTIGAVDGGIHDSAIAGRDVIFHIGPLKLSRRVAFLLVTMLLIAVAAVIVNAVSTTRIFIAATALTPTLTVTTSPTPVPTFTPTPLPFLPARAGEVLIVIAAFHRTEGVIDTDIHNRIRLALEDTIAKLAFLNLRVEIYPNSLQIDDRDAAAALAEHYKASMVIWGADVGVEVAVNCLNLKQPDFEAVDLDLAIEERALLVNPCTYASLVTENLPTHLTFLILFAIGQSSYVEADFENALATFQNARDLFASAGSQPGSLAEAHQKLSLLAQAAKEKRDLQKAIDSHNRAIELDPTNARAYNDRGLAYEKQGKYVLAIADYNKAIALKHQPLSWPYLNRGNIYKDRGKYDIALADYSMAIELDPNYLTAYNNRGYVYGKQGKYDLAIVDYTMAIERDPNYAFAYGNRGNAYRDQGEFALAIADYDKFVKLQPDDAKVYNNRGIVYEKQEKYDLAIADYTTAIERDPNYAQTYNNRGFAYSKQGKFALAIADYTTAIERDPNYAQAYNNRGDVYRKQGEFDQAIADFDKAIALDHDPLTWPYNNRGLAYRDQDKLEQAIADFNKAIELNPNYVQAYNDRGIAYGMHGEYARSIADFDKAIALDPNFALAYYNQGLAYEKKGEIDNAITTYREALKIGGLPDLSQRQAEQRLQALE